MSTEHHDNETLQNRFAEAREAKRNLDEIDAEIRELQKQRVNAERANQEAWERVWAHQDYEG